jgi:hypothetical protein
MMKNGSLLTLVFLFILTTSLTTSTFAATITWDGGASTDAWEHAANWSGNVVPGPSDRVIIDDASPVILSSDVTIIGLEISGGSSLTISTGFTLTTTGNAAGETDGIVLAGGSLTVNGSLNASGSTDEGIDIDNTTASLTVGANGTITVNGAGRHGIEVTGSFSNSGEITISSPGGNGIHITNSQVGAVENQASGSIVISGAQNGINIGTGGKIFTNYGELTLSGIVNDFFASSGVFHNHGVLRGDGTVANADNLVSYSGSTIAPGASAGTFILNSTSTINFSAGVTFEIEINGTTPGTEHDQLVTNYNIDISGSTLDLGGTHTPGPGDELVIFDIATGFNLTGTFNGIPEGGAVMLNGGTFYISYEGGVDGNDIVALFDSPLPIELTGFNARAMDDDVELNWTTASETNNDYFTIERSADGRNFEAIATVYGHGTTTEASNYVHIDNSPKNGLNYYRLKQTDFDGEFSYSDIRTATFENNENVKIYPTLVADNVILETNGSMDNEITVVVKDLNGRDCKSFELSSKSSSNELSLEDLTPGSYFIIVSDQSSVYTQKIIKL